MSVADRIDELLIASLRRALDTRWPLWCPETGEFHDDLYCPACMNRVPA